MAKVGLNFGEKMQIVDKSYRVLNDGLDIQALLGETTFGRVEGADIIYDEVREQGTVSNVNTGEIRGVVVGVRLSAQKGTHFVTITDMLPTEIEDLGLQFRDPVELEDVVVTYSGFNYEDNFKLFASRIKKAGGQKLQHQPKPEQQQQKDHN
ncbi:conjugal transfer protein [Streptococcus oriscaviae]|uniref:Conjugal transfer protein n=1 Tax=Streptococcus oriscaviae TaxID=2781599 RepID=A0ABX7YII9_9STRE|nr:conjugal transfer protein [Streptococcus oriscaviae]QUE53560.1 conjugal transfer protein [Streptococcus oriscaviae]